MAPPRFGHQITSTTTDDAVNRARRAEELGFDVVLIADHVGGPMAPLPTLAAIAEATERIRLGTYVLNNEMRNPVQLAWEVATIDRLSGGRFELGLGAGHTPAEFAATGIKRLSARIRKERLAESVEVLRLLLRGETVDHDGRHYWFDGACVGAAAQEHLPILVGGNGEALLHHAGSHADGVGLTGMGRTLADGHNHAVDWTAARLELDLARVAAGAAQRIAEVELSALVQMVELTDDRRSVLSGLAGEVDGLTVEDASTTPYLMVGSVDEIAGHVVACCERWGIDTFVVRALDEFAPVMNALR